MMEVDPDQNLADIRDAVRKYEDEVPELKEVKLSANKDELIEQTNQALEDYLERITSLGEQPELHTGIAGEPVVTGGGSGPTGAESQDAPSSEDARVEGEGTPLEDARQEILGEGSEEADSEEEDSEEEGPEEDSEEEGSGEESKEESSEENVGAPGQATAPPTSPHSPMVI
jgi:hypothetical protein